jgi:uncharacterized protein (TIGR03067 family)
MRTFLSLLAASLILATAISAEDTRAREREKLQGDWTAVKAEQNGKPDESVRGHQLTFKGDRFTIRSKGKVLYQGTYKLDPSKKPAAIDFVHGEGDLKEKVWLGIYQLDGDMLQVCDNAPDLSKGRPTTFTSKADSGHILITFQRTKP